MPLKGLDFPRGLTLDTVTAFISQGDRRGLAEWLARQFGDEAGEDLTVENLINLLSAFGFTGPLSAYAPPVCSPVLHTNLIVSIDAGDSKEIGLQGCDIKGGTRLYKSLVVSPLNTTAEDSVTLKQTLVGGDKFYVGLFSNPACGVRPGNFSTFENVCVPCGHCIKLEFVNADAASRARVQVEAESWIG